MRNIFSIEVTIFPLITWSQEVKITLKKVGCYYLQMLTYFTSVFCVLKLNSIIDYFTRKRSSDNQLYPVYLTLIFLMSWLADSLRNWFQFNSTDVKVLLQPKNTTRKIRFMTWSDSCTCYNNPSTLYNSRSRYKLHASKARWIFNNYEPFSSL